MFKLQYWNIFLEQWVDLTDERYTTYAAAKAAQRAAHDNGMRVGSIKIVGVTE